MNTIQIELITVEKDCLTPLHKVRDDIYKLQTHRQKKLQETRDRIIKRLIVFKKPKSKYSLYAKYLIL